MKWYKTSNDLIDKPKLRLISQKLSIPHAVTIATFHALLTRCSKKQSDSIDLGLEELAEEINLQLGILNSLEILIAFENKVIKDGKVLDWHEFQGSTSTERVKEWRKKKKDETLQNVAVTDVTQIRGEEKREEENSNIPFSYFMETWNELTNSGLAEIKQLTEKRKKHIAQRWNHELKKDLKEWDRVCEQVKGSEFLRGINNQGWRADFDWVILPTNMLKILEGKYAPVKLLHPVKPARPQIGTQTLKEMYDL